MGTRYQKRKALIVGDTSKFHLGSKTNYLEFMKLARSKYEITGEIPYDSFGTQFDDFYQFSTKLKRSEWWEKVEVSDVFIVHGEGLTEKHANYTYHYLYFSKLAKKMKKKSHLVNFSMYESDNYLNLIRDFDYIASRDVLTKRHLQLRGIESELSFDCCILSSGPPVFYETDGHVALIRGRNWIKEEYSKHIHDKKKYGCGWVWEGESIRLDSFEEYIPLLRKASFSITTSFHANIISYMAGIPFISIDVTNPKYHSLEIELLPPRLRNPKKLMDKSNRKVICRNYSEIFPDLVRRAKLNIK